MPCPAAGSIVGTGDFNGDGRDDILWRSERRRSSPTGSARPTAASPAMTPMRSRSVPTSWHIVGTGDFNGDGRDDILWRNDSGPVSDWLGQANGGFVGNDANACGVRADELARGRHRRLQRRRPRRHPLAHDNGGSSPTGSASANGSFASNDANAWRTVPTNWHIAGTGDFNGDGRDDILWRNDDGAVQRLGSARPTAASPATMPTPGRSSPTNWQIARPATSTATAATTSSGATATASSDQLAGPRQRQLHEQRLQCARRDNNRLACAGAGYVLDLISKAEAEIGTVRTEVKKSPLSDCSISIFRWLAGAAGFEPANAGTKNRCLTTWRRPSRRPVDAGKARL